MADPEIKEIRLADLFDLPGEIDRTTSTIWLRAYAVRGIPRKLMHHLNEIYPCHLRILNHPVWARFIALAKPLELVDLAIDLITADDGGLQIIIRDSNPKIIPASTYCFVATVFDFNGTPGNEQETKANLDASVGLLRLHFGWASFNHIILDQEIKLSDGAFNNRTGAIRIPQKSEGPFLAPVNWYDSEEIAQVLSSHQAAQRLLRAMEYIHRGISDSDYTAYWIALELICDSHEENGIVDKLSETYGIPFKTIKKEDTLGHKSLLRSRHNFFHKGVRPNLSADAERYFQLILLDLLRNELNLQSKQHAIEFLKTQPDLFALGLTPKRSDETGAAKRAEPISEEMKSAMIKAYEDSFSRYRQDAEILWPDKNGSGVT